MPLIPPIDKITNTELDKLEQLREMPDGPWKNGEIKKQWNSQITEMMPCKECTKYQQCTIETSLCRLCFYASLKLSRTFITNHNERKVVGFSINGDMLIPRFQSDMKVLTHGEWMSIQDKVASFYKKSSPQNIRDVNKYRVFLNESNNKDEDADKRIGFVYLLRAENGLYKIGKTINISLRLKTIQHQFPIDIKLMGHYQCADYSAEETRLLRLTKEYKQGDTEWHDFPSETAEEWEEYFTTKMDETIYDAEY